MNASRAAAAGAIGTGVLTALWLVEPSLGLPTIAVGQILSTFMSVSVALVPVGVAGGWVVHLVFGILLALIYASAFADRLPGLPAARGAIYGLLVFLVAQTIFMPLVGGGFFSRGDGGLLLGSLIGHLAYGIVVGWIYGLPIRLIPAAQQPSPSRTIMTTPTSEPSPSRRASSRVHDPRTWP